MKDRRTLSHKRVNLLRRKRYREDQAFRVKCIARAKRSNKYIKRPTSFTFDGVEYIIVSEACKILELDPKKFLYLQYKGIIPDLPKDPNGWRYMIRRSNVYLLKFVLKTIESEKFITRNNPTVKEAIDFIFSNWNRNLEYLTAESND